jgi:hypothetical protein
MRSEVPWCRRKIDLELVACGCVGHALVGTVAAELRPEDELYAREQGSIRWLRCLRCDCWVSLTRPENPAGDIHRTASRSRFHCPARRFAIGWWCE